MTTTYEIHPKVGVARLGNSPDSFYLAPHSVGGLPIECDARGEELFDEDGEPMKVREFKDSLGRIRRQAARFTVFAHTDDGADPVELGTGDVASITWTVHVANKKPVWFTFSELLGNLEFGDSNSYANRHVGVNNSDVTDPAKRKALMIDPGPRSVDSPEDWIPISRYNIPDGYPNGSFPPVSAGGETIESLGDITMDAKGRLIALGAYGNVSGTGDITSFRGASGFWDDICDGFVLATITLTTGETIDATPAWLLVGSPKFAPELVNITTLDDTMYDVAVRKMGANRELFPGTDTAGSFPSHQGYTPLDGFNPDYFVNFDRDVKPILERMAGYRWVADIPYLADFASPSFDPRDASDATASARHEFFDLFRVPVNPEDYGDWIHVVENGPNTLFRSDGLPLLPLNSGDNSVTNDEPIYKFETLSPTQYFFMNQWAAGKFATDRPEPLSLVEAIDRAHPGNCVGAPFSPGIETTWVVRNAPLYDAPGHLKLAHFNGSNEELSAYYAANGLSTTQDEAEGEGCEPGALTKRMAIPWQADFAECTVQTPNISNPTVNQFADGTGVEVPPTYYVYWWPPQSPMHVVTGALQPQDQVIDAAVSNIAGQPVIPAGQRVPYQRGIDGVQDMITSWSRLGFIVDHGTDRFPYFVEQERSSAALLQVQINNGTKG